MILLFLFCAFRSGTDRYYYKKAIGDKADGREALYYFRIKNIPLLIRFYFNLYIRKALIFLLCFLPVTLNYGALYIYITYYRASYTVSVVLIFISVLFAINGLIFFVRFNSLLFVARYYFASGEYKGFSQLFKLSLNAVQGKRQGIFIKKLSFIPWFMCCIFLLPISFVRSYYNLTMAALAADLISNGIYKSDKI